MLINLSICLSDIPKERIKQANNGKKYLSLTVQDLREVDQYGNTHSVYIAQTKDERMEKAKRIYLGNGKEFVFEARTPNTEQIEAMPSASFTEDLPF